MYVLYIIYIHSKLVVKIMSLIFAMDNIVLKNNFKM